MSERLYIAENRRRGRWEVHTATALFGSVAERRTLPIAQRLDCLFSARTERECAEFIERVAAHG